MKRILYQPFFIRLFNWEYWPFNVVYGPLFLYWFFLSLKARSFFFFNTSNPSIKNGGFLMESKKEIYALIPFEYYPSTLFFKACSSLHDILALIKQRNLKYPLIGKPDIGMKGMMVKKLENEKELLSYVTNSKVDFLIQEYVPFKNEIGIFYYRYPNEEKGHISGIVKKELLAVTGNGVSTVEQLLLKNKRAVLQLPVLRKTEKDKMNIVLKKDEEFIVVPYGNHVRGAKFLDDSRLIDEELTKTIDSICKKVDGFYFGRLDICYNDWEELKQGKNFSIIELNGSGSEPTHIYDPRHSVFWAWKEIAKHWKILYRVSKLNHQLQNTPYMTTRMGLDMFKQNSEYVKLLKGN
jgi:sporulation protein YlmC with PRC-barrel domain